MLLSKKVKIKWNAKIKKHYVDLGYVYTKMKDEFEVDVNHLTDGSNAIVDVECDYCKQHYTKYWCNYITENKKSKINKDACGNCKHLKASESVLEQYGVNNVFQLEDIKDKISKTNIERYGCENPFAAESIKNKLYQTNIEKYGVKYPQQNSSVREKTKKTCIEKYGVDTTLYNSIYHLKGEDNPNWKGGVKHHRQERVTNEYRKWRKEVYSRDKYTCQCCNNKNSKNNKVNLNAHHILNWNDYEELRYEVENGITLCDKCHYLFHSIYGKHKNNKSQLNEFLLNYGKKIC